MTYESEKVTADCLFSAGGAMQQRTRLTLHKVHLQFGDLIVGKQRLLVELMALI
jgi:hypothetical protein